MIVNLSFHSSFTWIIFHLFGFYRLAAFCCLSSFCDWNYTWQQLYIHIYRLVLRLNLCCSHKFVDNSPSSSQDSNEEEISFSPYYIFIIEFWLGFTVRSIRRILVFKYRSSSKEAWYFNIAIRSHSNYTYIFAFPSSNWDSTWSCRIYSNHHD